MRLKRALATGVLVLFVLGICAQAYSSTEDILYFRLRGLTLNRSQENSLLALRVVLGCPTKVFRSEGMDVWFYKEMNVHYINQAVKEVYVVLKNGKIKDVKIADSPLNPYNQFSAD